MRTTLVLMSLVIGVLIANRHPSTRVVFRWLPVPLWCYVLPMLARSFGWLPEQSMVYRTLTEHFLPFALALLLLEVDVPSLQRVGARALVAASVGAAGIVFGAPVMFLALQKILGPESWKGVATLVGTWTGGSLNLLALRSLLDTPDGIMAPLIVVDTMVAYSGMALWVAVSGFQKPIDKWLRAKPLVIPEVTSASSDSAQRGWRAWLLCVCCALGLTLISTNLAMRLPTHALISSASGWTILLVTTGSLLLSFLPRVRQCGTQASFLGYPCLYVVLAATGAQASLQAFASSPQWLLLGLGIVVIHGGLLILAGRLLRLPVGLLATASQANIGGVVSSPLVGAVYHRSLAPVGLVLALAGNALGTYFGLFSAWLCQRWLMP